MCLDKYAYLCQLGRVRTAADALKDAQKTVEFEQRLLKQLNARRQ